jgi:hypothetical protein
MSEKRLMTEDEIAELVRSIEIDSQQMELLAKLPPERRLLPGLQAQEFTMSALRGTFRKKFPELSLPEINMKVLAYLTPVRMEK